MEKLLTISIAAYNVGQYLHQALSSLCVPEILDEIEVLIISDGSTDNTAEIAREFESRYPGTYRLIEKENGGYGSTVNLGVAEAKGKYFRLLDGDDFFDSDAFRSFVEHLRTAEADLLMTFLSKCDCDGGNLDLRKQVWSVHVGETLKPSELTVPLLTGIWQTTVLTERIRKNLVELPLHTLYTDQLFSFCALAGASRIEFRPEAVYIYRLGRDGQSVNSDSLRKHYQDELKVLNKVLKLYASSPLVTDENRAMLRSRVRHYYMFGFQTVCILKRSAEHFRLLRSLEGTLRKLCPDVYKEAWEKSPKIRHMRESGYLLYLFTAGNDKYWS